MFLEPKLPVAPQTLDAGAKPKRRVELHVHVAHDYFRVGEDALVFEPRGILEAAAQHEIVATLGFPLRGGRADVVLVAVAICEKHGWQLTTSWLEGERRELHAKIAKEIDGP